MPVTVFAGPDWPTRTFLVRAAAGPDAIRVDAGDAAAGQLSALAAQPSLFGPPAPLWLAGAAVAGRDLLDDAAAQTATVVLDADTVSPALRAAVKRHRWQLVKTDLPNARSAPGRAARRAADSYPLVPGTVAALVGRRCVDDVAATESVLAALTLLGGSAPSELVEQLCAVAASSAPWNVSGMQAASALLGGSASAPGWLASHAAKGDPGMVGWLRASRSGVPVEVAAVAAALSAPPPV